MPNEHENDAKEVENAPSDANPESYDPESDEQSAKRTKGGRQPGAGRPSKLDEERHTRIVNAVKNGNFLEVAAQFAGVSKETFYDWLRKAEVAREKVAKKERPSKHEQRCLALADDLAQALAESEVRDNLQITRAIQEGDWRAAAWRLSKKARERWGDQTPLRKTEVSATVGGMPTGSDDKEITFTLKIAEAREEQQQEEEEVNAGVKLP